MKFPEQFYYRQKGSAMYYSTSSGVLDAARAIEHTDMFAKFGAEEQIPKTIIFVYPHYLSAFEYWQIKEYVGQLCTQRFKVYFWVRGKLELITEDNIEDLFSDREKSFYDPYTSPDIILLTASGLLRQNVKQIEVLDAYWIENLILKPRALIHPKSRITTTQLVCRYLDIDCHLPYLKTQGIEPLFIIDSVAETSYEIMKSLKENGFTQFQLDISKIVLDDGFEWLCSFIQLCKALPGAEDFFNYELEWDGKTAPPLALFRSIEKLKIFDYAAVSEQDLHFLLTQRSSLQKMLAGKKFFNIYSRVSDKIFSSVTELEVSEIPASVGLDVIAKMYPNLEYLCIKDHSIKTAQACFKKLQVLRLEQAWSFPELQELFAGSPDLCQLKLSLRSREEIEEFLLLPPGVFKNLKKLSIDTLEPELPSPDISKFLRLAPSLKNLHLSNKTFDCYWFLPTVIPSKLIIDRNLEKNRAMLKQSSPKKLGFASFGEDDLLNQNGVFLFSGLSLPHLETVMAKEIGPEVAQALFAAAPNLRNKAELLLRPPKEVKEASGKPKTSKHQKESRIDADTSLNPNQHYNLNRIFYSTDANRPHPPINEDRISSFSHCEVNPNPCGLSDAFLLSNTRPLDLEEVKIPCSSVDVSQHIPALKQQIAPTQRLLYGIQKLNIGPQWQPLASRSASETLLEYHTDPEIEVEFAYSKRDNLYYLRSNTTQELTVDFALSVPEASHAQVKTVAQLPQAIQTKITALNNFGSGSLQLPKKNLKGSDYLSYLETQEKGACRHRAVVLSTWMQKNYPEIPARTLTNACHAFVELFFADAWITCDLGGYPARLNIKELANPLTGAQELANPLTGAQRTSQEALAGPIKPNPFRGYFQKKPSKSYQSLLPYFLELMTQEKSLIVASSDQEVRALNLALRRFCKSTGRPSYYLHCADDISCQSAYIERHPDDSGTLRKGPGGPLSDFLDEAENLNSVLVTNYNQFKDDEFVNTNSFLDKQPLADGKPIPKKAIRIGTINGKQIDLTEKRDFTSRFDSCDLLPVPQQSLEEVLRDHAPDRLETLSNPFVIALYHGTDWKERLLGAPKPSEKGFTFSKGLLKEALDSGRPIVFQNPPLNNEAFEYFLGCLRQDYPQLRFALSQGYDWKALKKQLLLDASIEGMPLNPSNLNELFECYVYQETKKIYITVAGQLQKHRNQTVALYITRDLDEDSWARVLEEARAHQVTLKVSLAPGVTFPEALELNAPLIAPRVKPFAPEALTEKTVLIESTEVDTSLKQLLSQGDWIPVDISECRPDSLLMQVEVNKEALKQENPQLLFTQTPQLLLQALAQGANIVLTGTPNDELRDALSVFLLERAKQNKVSGRLVVLSDAQLPAFSSFVLIHRHEVEQQEQAALLGTALHLNDKPLKPLFRLEAERLNPQGFEGFDNLPLPKLADFNAADSESLAAEVLVKRQQLIDKALSTYPYVFVAGLSGVGKSTFVEEELKGYTLFPGEDKMLAWASSEEANPLLVIDEANLTNRDWTELEGLFHKPPRVRINGVLKTVSPNHKVLFIGNPQSYSTDRKLAALFKRRGGAVVFDPLPLAFIYERSLRPLIENDPFTSLKAQEVAQSFLEVYRFLCQCSTTDVLITPRELEMMALLTRNYCLTQGIHEPNEVLEVARHYAYELSKQVVPDSKRDEFEAHFAPKKELKRFAIPNLKDFKLTASRHQAVARLQECLSLRDAKQQAKHSKLKAGGLNGILIEGEPGIGKSVLAFALLRANGYEKASLEQSQLPAKPFYYLPAKWPYEAKEALLIKAFHEGAVVVIDEINASASLERLLNCLMSGKDLDKKEAKVPGFFVIGTQNPATMPGRRQASTAFLRRFLFIELSNYTFEEMMAILSEKFTALSGQDWFETLTQIVVAFKEDYALAQAMNSNDLPSFREAERLVEHLAQQELSRRQHEALQSESSADALVIHTEPADTAVSIHAATPFHFFQPEGLSAGKQEIEALSY